MGVNASVSGSTGEILTLAERDMLAVGILVALGKTEINDEDVIFVLIISSNQKVIRLNISMNDPFFVDLLNSLNLFEII
jgi:hypothetical protein